MPEKIVLVLQARLDSSRLPGKSLLPLGIKKSQPFILCVMEALKHVKASEYVLACPDDCISEFSSLAKEAGFELFAGPKEDVLERYCMAARNFDANYIIRATGDNPFVFADSATAIAGEALSLNSDYAAYSGLPLGSGVEVVKVSALLQSGKNAVEPYEREHVCPHLYGHPDKFLLHRPLAPVCWQNPSLRLTVDTHKDYLAAQSLYAELEKTECSLQRHNGETILKICRQVFPEMFL